MKRYLCSLLLACLLLTGCELSSSPPVSPGLDGSLPPQSENNSGGSGPVGSATLTTSGGGGTTSPTGSTSLVLEILNPQRELLYHSLPAEETVSRAIVRRVS